MKILHVPNQHISQCETGFDKIELLLEAGAEAAIDQVNWKKDFPKSLPVTVRAAHDGERLYLYYQVFGEAIRAANTEDFGSVWEDSCVEFFMQREGKMFTETSNATSWVPCWQLIMKQGKRAHS